MKDYIKGKLKKAKKNVAGSFKNWGGDERKKRAARQQANALSVIESFSNLNPPLSADILVGTAKLDAVDLLSDGPIEGFFNNKGETCTALEATYLNNIPVIQEAKNKETYDNLKIANLKGCYIDYSEPIIDLVNRYKSELNSRFETRESVPNADDIQGSSDGSIFRGFLVTPKLTLQSALGGTYEGRVATIAQIPAIDSSVNRVTDIGLAPTVGRRANTAGKGYRVSPYMQRSYYGQTQISNSDGRDVPTNNFYSITRPKIYQGSLVQGAGLNIESGGSIFNSFTTRAWYKGLNPAPNDHTSTTMNTFQEEYVQPLFFYPSRWNTPDPSNNYNGDYCRPTGQRPYDSLNFEFSPGSDNPDGFKEPIIAELDKMLENFPRAKHFPVQPSLRYESMNNNGSINAEHVDSVTIGGLTRSNVLRLTGRGGATDSVSNRTANMQFTNYFTGTNNDGTNYRITGSYYIPAGNRVKGFRFFWAGVGGPPTVNAASSLGAWTNFDVEFTNPDPRTSNNRSGSMYMYYYAADSTSTTPAGSDVVRNFWTEDDQIYFHGLTVIRQSGKYPSLQDSLSGSSAVNTSNSGFLIFNASGSFGNNRISGHRKIGFALDSGNLYTDHDGFDFAVNDIDGFTGTKRFIKDSMCYEAPLGYASFDQYNLFTITGNSVAYEHYTELFEKDPKRFQGAFMWPVYFGKNGVGMSGVSDGSLDRVLISANDDHEVKQLKYGSGVTYGYDVFSGDSNGDMFYAHLANPNVKNLLSETTGKKLQVKVTERSYDKFNYTNVAIQSKFGEEIQTPIVNDSKTEFVYSFQLMGPYEQTPLDPERLDQINESGFMSYSAGLTLSGYTATNNGEPVYQPSLSSRDFYTTGKSLFRNSTDASPNVMEGSPVTGKNDFSSWNLNPAVDADENAVTHLVKREEVERVAVNLRLNALSHEREEEQNPAGQTIDLDKGNLSIQVEVGFQNVDSSIFEPQITNFFYQGIVENPYPLQTEDVNLPSHSQLLSSFPDLNKRSIVEKYPRYVRVRKLDYETISVRVRRDVVLQSILEIIPCNFSYPFSAMNRVQLDARSFAQIPNRTYNTRLKKILIPSNYFPLDNDGADKRFVEKASDLGTRVVYDGDWDGSFKLGWSDNPAWILYDLLISSRYGLGSRIDDLEDINIFNLYKIGRYCDAVAENGNFVGMSDGIGGLEPRFSCNVLIDASDNAYEIINQIATVFNGKPFWCNGIIDFYSDRPLETSAHFSNANVFDGIFNYMDISKSANFNVVEVQFQNKEKDFEITSETVEDEDGIRKDGKIVRKINGKGTTSRGQARRLAKYILYSNKLEREIVNFRAGSESLALNVGEIIEIKDELKTFEVGHARVLNKTKVNSKYYVHIEDTIDVNSIVVGNEGGLHIFTPSGQKTQEELYNLARTGGNLDNVLLREQDSLQARNVPIQSVRKTGHNLINLEISNTGIWGEIPTGSFAGIDLNTDQSNAYRVLSITPAEDNLYDVSATQYNSGKFNFIEGDEEVLDFTQSTPFNIGEPEHIVNAPTQPEGFSYSPVTNHMGTLNLDLSISGNANGTEEKYLISVVHPNGMRKEKKVSKQNNAQGGYLVTNTSFKNISIYGEYNIFVSSIE